MYFDAKLKLKLRLQKVTYFSFTIKSIEKINLTNCQKLNYNKSNFRTDLL